jgi:hypothetical protein
VPGAANTLGEVARGRRTRALSQVRVRAHGPARRCGGLVCLSTVSVAGESAIEPSSASSIVYHDTSPRESQ